MNRNQLVRDLRSMGLVVSNAPGDSSQSYGITADLNAGDRAIANCIKTTADAGDFRVVYGLSYTIESHDRHQFVLVQCQLRTRL